MGALPTMTMSGAYLSEPYCSRCGNDTSELGCVTIHRDTDLQEKETSYYDLCPRCMKRLDNFLAYWPLENEA